MSYPTPPRKDRTTGFYKALKEEHERLRSGKAVEPTHGEDEKTVTSERLREAGEKPVWARSLDEKNRDKRDALYARVYEFLKTDDPMDHQKARTELAASGIRDWQVDVHIRQAKRWGQEQELANGANREMSDGRQSRDGKKHSKETADKALNSETPEHDLDPGRKPPRGDGGREL